MRHLRSVAAAMMAWIAGIAPAQADTVCAYSSVDVDLATHKVPPAGPVVVDVECAGSRLCLERTPEVAVLRSGVPAAGSAEILRVAEPQGEGPTRSRMFIIWTPAKDLSSRASYQVHISGRGIKEGALADPVFNVELGSVPAAPKVRRLPVRLAEAEVGTGERFCCTPDLSCNQVCFTEDAINQALLRFDGANREETPYYVYRLRPLGGAGEAEETPWRRLQSGMFTASFDEPAASYCAALEAMNLADGTVTRHDFCKSAPEGWDVGELSANQPNFADYPFVCEVPPSPNECDSESCPALPRSLLASWCDDRRAFCEDSGDDNCVQEMETHCAALAELPEVEPESTAPAKAATVTEAREETMVTRDSAADTSTESLATETIASGDAGLTYEAGGGGGSRCSTSQGGSSAPALWAGLALVGALVLRRRLRSH